jgi:hypothetical protein
MQGTPYGVSADGGKTIFGVAQGGLQRAQGPCCRAVLFPVRDARDLGQNSPLLICGITDGRPPAMARHHSREPVVIEPGNPLRNRVTVVPADPPSSCRITLPLGNGQNCRDAGHLRRRRAARPAQPG